MFNDPRYENWIPPVMMQYYSLFGNNHGRGYRHPIPPEFMPSSFIKRNASFYRYRPIGHWLSHYNDPWCACHYYLPQPHPPHFFRYPTSTAMNDPPCQSASIDPLIDRIALSRQQEMKTRLLSDGWKIGGLVERPVAPPNSPINATPLALPWIPSPQPDADKVVSAEPVLTVEQRWDKIQETASQLDHALDMSKSNGVLFSMLEDEASFHTCSPPQDHCVIEIENQKDHKPQSWWHRLFSRFI